MPYKYYADANYTGTTVKDLMTMTLSDLEREFVDLLRKIRSKPAMYIGSQSFERLHGFILGFLYARLAPTEPDLPLLIKFSQWQRAHTGINKEASWQQFIRFYSLDDRSAFEAFYHDFEVFLNELQEG